MRCSQDTAEKLRDGSAALPADFRARDVRRKGWAGLTRPDDVEAACELLADHRCLIATPQPKTAQGGRPTSTYRLNPLAKKSTLSPG